MRHTSNKRTMMAAKQKRQESSACCGGETLRLQPKVRDPLCGKSVDVDSPHRLAQGGRSHRFCSESCQVDFTRAMDGEAVLGVTFNCEMHPEARQEHPGECPLCGIALAPMRVPVAGNSRLGRAGGIFGRLRAALGV